MSSFLIISRHYMDENNGGSNASKGFVWSLGYLCADCTLIYPERLGGNSSKYIPFSIKKIPVYDNRSKWRKGIDVYRGRLHRFVDFVKKHLKKEKYDIVILDHSISSAGLIDSVRATGAKIVTIHHNVEANYIKDNPPGWLYRIPFVFFSKRAEREALRKSDVNLTLTDADSNVFKGWYPERNLHLHTVGVCDYLWKPWISPVRKTFNRSFVISGSLNFKQSAVPVLDFIHRYYPIMKKIIPGCKLIVAGRNPNEKVKKICIMNSVELIENPENMDDVVKRASVYICPINVGSGIKLRVMDGLKRGLPVVCHKISAVGYAAIEKSGCLYSYDDERSFANAVMRIFEKEIDPDYVYMQYRKEFSFFAGVNRLKEILEEEKVL